MATASRHVLAEILTAGGAWPQRWHDSGRSAKTRGCGHLHARMAYLASVSSSERGRPRACRWTMRIASAGWLPSAIVPRSMAMSACPGICGVEA